MRAGLLLLKRILKNSDGEVEDVEDTVGGQHKDGPPEDDSSPPPPPPPAPFRCFLKRMVFTITVRKQRWGGQWISDLLGCNWVDITSGIPTGQGGVRHHCLGRGLSYVVVYGDYDDRQWAVNNACRGTV